MSVYSDIGVGTIINAKGAATRLSGGIVTDRCRSSIRSLFRGKALVISGALALHFGMIFRQIEIGASRDPVFDRGAAA